MSTDTTFPANAGADELAESERRRRYDHAVDLVRLNTVHNQPALISRRRLGTLEGYREAGRNDDRLHGAEYLDAGLQAAFESRDLLRISKDGERLYGYAGDVEYLRAIINEVREWEPVPKDVIGWCNVRIADLQEER